MKNVENKVPEEEIIYSVLNRYFSDTEVGGYVEEDKDGVIYIFNEDGNIYCVMPPDIWMELI